MLTLCLRQLHLLHGGLLEQRLDELLLRLRGALLALNEVKGLDCLLRLLLLEVLGLLLLGRRHGKSVAARLRKHQAL